jgi:hypothetical protein
MAPAPRIPDFEPFDPRMIELYRRATPTQKLAVVARLNATLIELKAADIRARHPDLADAQQRAQLRRWWMTACD